MLYVLSRRQLKSDEHSSQNIKFHQKIPKECMMLSILFRIRRRMDDITINIYTPISNNVFRFRASHS